MMSKLTGKQVSILSEAVKCKVDALAAELTSQKPGVAMVPMMASKAAVLAQQVSLAQQSGASFEQLLCLIYGISERQ